MRARSLAVRLLLWSVSGKRDVWRVAMLGAGLSFGGTVFVAEGEIGLVVVLLFFAGLSSGCGAAMGASVMADVIDYDEYVSGERKEGAYAATQGFAIKSEWYVDDFGGLVGNVGPAPTQAQPQAQPGSFPPPGAGAPPPSAAGMTGSGSPDG